MLSKLHAAFFGVWLFAFAAAAAASAQPGSSWTGVDQALGRPGATQADGVRRYSFPRSDLNVQLDGVSIKPALALGSWIAFEKVGQKSVVMGDLVLTPDEANPVMSELLKGGIRITALHNHLLRSSPPTMYMHVMGEGDAAQLAATLHSALALSHTPLQPPPAPPPIANADLPSVARIIGRPGKANGDVLQFSIPRRERIVDDGVEVPASMGTGTAVNFQTLAGGRAAATGDFVLLASEVDPVMRVLRSNGIEVTALHTHMLDEQPKLYFMHFWAVGDASALATALRSALDRMNVW